MDRTASTGGSLTKASLLEGLSERPLVVDDLDLVIRVAIDGVGVAFMGEHRAAHHLASGALVRVLEDWCRPLPRFLIYYPIRRLQPAALAALIEILRL